MIVAIGEFDGYHLGHRLLLAEARRLAEKNGTTWGVLTFSPYPGQFFDGDKKVLFTERGKAAVAKFLGIPKVITLRFDEALRKMTYIEFLEKLKNDLEITGIVIGEDFRLGRDAAGDAGAIKNFCARNGMECSVMQPIEYARAVSGGKKLSSSALRSWGASGEFGKIRRFLGFPYPVIGRVVRGDGRGAQLGYPTANVSVSDAKILPGDGVYAASVPIDGEWKPGAVFVGTSPTFGGINKRNVEVHIIGYHGNLYDKRISVFLEESLRQPRKYENNFELIKVITQSVREAEEIFKKNYFDSKFMYDELEKAFSGAAETQIINLSEISKPTSPDSEYKRSYITLDKSRINEIFHPNFIENLSCSLAEAIVRPGECTERHIHTESTEMYYGLEGSGFIYIEGEGKAVMTTGSAFLIRAGTPHHICANEDNSGKPLSFLCICTPPYTHEQTQLINQQ